MGPFMQVLELEIRFLVGEGVDLERFLCLEKNFRVLCIGGALEHIWGISWCLEAWKFRNWSIGGVQVHIWRLVF